MKYVHMLLMLFAVTIASGCAQNINKVGGIYSNVDQSVTISKDASILVRPFPKGDVLTNKRYIDLIVQNMIEAGFINTSSSIESYDFYLVFDYRADAAETVRSVPIFGSRVTGSTTSCTQNAYGVNQASVNCQSYNQTQGVISGFREVVDVVEYSVMQMTIAKPKDEMVFDIVMSTPRGSCSKWKNYEFLTEQAFDRLNFEDPVDENFRVEMPEGYQCR